MDNQSRHIKILIADDETLARKRIVSLLDQTWFNVQIFEATTGKETIEVIESHAPHIVFLDIKMTDMTGFEVLVQLPKEHIPIVIFVTAFDQYAVEAFEVQALDFLLKPYKKARFETSLERAVLLLEESDRSKFQNKLQDLISYIKAGNSSLENAESYLDRIVLKSNKKYVFVDVKSIIYIKASGYYAEIFTDKVQKYIYRSSMTDLIQKLDPKTFSRVNRSTILNRDYIKEIISEGKGDFSIMMMDHTAYSLSRNLKQEFLTLMGIR